ADACGLGRLVTGQATGGARSLEDTAVFLPPPPAVPDLPDPRSGGQRPARPPDLTGRLPGSWSRCPGPAREHARHLELVSLAGGDGSFFPAADVGGQDGAAGHHGVAAGPGGVRAVSQALARDRLGVTAVLSFIMASVAPLTVAAGVIQTAYAATGLTGIPAAFGVIAVILAVFATGYVAMARSVTNSGAFYALIRQGLGKVTGVYAVGGRVAPAPLRAAGGVAP
ncbi:MAG: hypothetical protein M3Y33_14820, partial [Actinomycetota bacterium]|nr:hypothetical protein [Actinomycetota bacterium]